MILIFGYPVPIGAGYPSWVRTSNSFSQFLWRQVYIAGLEAIFFEVLGFLANISLLLVRLQEVLCFLL